MLRVLSFAVLLLTALSWVMWLEVKAVRSDQEQMRALYDGFLNQKVGGRPLYSRIVPNSMAVFKSNVGPIGCALLNGK